MGKLFANWFKVRILKNSKTVKLVEIFLLFKWKDKYLRYKSVGIDARGSMSACEKREGKGK